MIPLTSAAAKGMALAVIYFRAIVPDQWRAFERTYSPLAELYDRGVVSPNSLDALNNDEQHVTPQDAMQGVEQVLAHREGQLDGTTLIDSMVEILKGPMVSMRLSAGAISRLRERFLTQEELNQTAQQLTQHLHCAKCEAEFQPQMQELVVIQRDGMTNVPKLLCLKCGVPTTQRCMEEGCTDMAQVSKGLLNALKNSKTTCGRDHRPQKSVPDGVEATPFDAGDGIFLTADPPAQERHRFAVGEARQVPLPRPAGPVVQLGRGAGRPFDVVAARAELDRMNIVLNEPPILQRMREAAVRVREVAEARERDRE